MLRDFVRDITHKQGTSKGQCRIDDFENHFSVHSESQVRKQQRGGLGRISQDQKNSVPFFGFLDRMVADLISNATGLPVKGLIRKVGAKKLLLGGAALAAGGMAVAKMRETSAPSASPPPPPPLPPTPGTGALPPTPLPPLPIAAETEPEIDDDLGPGLTASIVRTMIAAALADGHLAPEEREAIHSNLNDSGLSPEQVSRAHSDLLSPASPATLAALIRQESERDVLYRAAILIIMADKDLNEAERSWLDDFAGQLALDDGRKAAIEGEFL